METESEKSSGKAKPQELQKQPEEWRRDLNPDHMAGQNIGTDAPAHEQGWRTAHDHKDVHRSLAHLSDEDLKQIPIVPSGTRLQQGATYIDLAERPPREFTARGDMEAGDGNVYVPKDQVPYTVWNRLIGEPKPGQ
jgi:hypothetical protein